MTSIISDIENKTLGFTVYTPDCMQSNLMGTLDSYIADSTGLRPVYRHWFRHSHNTLRKFYGSQTTTDEQDADFLAKYVRLDGDELRSEHVFAVIQITGPSLLTFWQGENVFAKLLKIKGDTHPAKADPSSIRGRFWCDTPVCNLMHCSDHAEDAVRELTVLGLSDLNLQPAIFPLLRSMELQNTRHCAIATACIVANRLLLCLGKEPVLFELPYPGISREVVNVAEEWLKQIAESESDKTLLNFVDGYLSGDIRKFLRAEQNLPLTDWEHHVLRAGILSRSDWVRLYNRCAP